MQLIFCVTSHQDPFVEPKEDEIIFKRIKSVYDAIPENGDHIKIGDTTYRICERVFQYYDNGFGPQASCVFYLRQ